MAPVLSEERDPWKIPQERPRLRRHGSTGQETTRVFFFHLSYRKFGVRSLVRSKEKKKRRGKEREPPRRRTFSTIVNKTKGKEKVTV